MNTVCGILCGVILSLLLLFAPSLAQARESLDTMLRSYLAEAGIPALAAAVAKDGEIVAAGAVGTRRAGADVAVTIDDRFHIGSDTKAMTSLLAAMLIEEGKLRWDSTPAEIFPEFAASMDKGFASVTLAQLLSHTSGLPSDNEAIEEVWERSFEQPGNLDEMRRFVVKEWGKQSLEAPPGTRFAYSNQGYITAGAMIERVTGTTWDELMFERIFNPLGMTTAGLGCQSSLGKLDAPLSHIVENGKLKPLLAGPNADNPQILGPAGIAHMSILDFVRWVSWNAGKGKRGPALVRPETLRKLHTPVIEASLPPGGLQTKARYGFGWAELEVAFAPHPVFQHTGSNNKNLASAWMDTQNDLAIVLAANVAGDKPKAALNALAQELYAKYAEAK